MITTTATDFVRHTNQALDGLGRGQSGSITRKEHGVRHNQFSRGRCQAL